MRRFSLHALLVCGATALSCLQDPNAPENDPEAPGIQFDELTRASVTLTGSVGGSDSDSSFGFIITEIVEGEERGEPIVVKADLQEDGKTFSCIADLSSGTTYSIRSYVTNVISRKLSSPLTITTPTTSKATVSNVMLIDGVLTAFVKDNGGRVLEEVGFIGGDTPNRKSLLRKEKIPATSVNENSFSLPISSFESGKTYFFVAYAIDEKEDVGYSPKVADVMTTSFVAFEEHEREVFIGENFTIKAIVTPEGVDDKFLTWQSSDPTIATVSEEGAVSPVGVGTATITATTPSGSSASFNCIVVSEAPAFPDEVFRQYVYKNFDTDWNGVLSRREAMAVTRISLDYDCQTLSGIGYFQNLYSLSCSNNLLRELDLSNNLSLSDLNCYSNRITTIDVSNNAYLFALNCHSNQLTSLDVSNNPYLDVLWCSSNQLTMIDVSHNPILRELNCSDNPLTTIDVSNNPNLAILSCCENQLTSLDVSNNPKLASLDCSSNQLTTLDISNNPNLGFLYCSSNQLTTLDVSNNLHLTELKCFSNQLTTLDVSNNPNLTSLDCHNNQLTTLDVSNNLNLSYLKCSDNPKLQDIWLKEGQTISQFGYPSGATIHYK